VSELTDLTLKEARKVLAQECNPLGLMASPEGYPHVWAQDSVITGLGAVRATRTACARHYTHWLGSSRNWEPSPTTSAWPRVGWITQMLARWTRAYGTSSVTTSNGASSRTSSSCAPTGPRWSGRCCDCATRTLTAAACWRCMRPPTGPTCWPTDSTSCTTTCSGTPRCGRWRRWLGVSRSRSGLCGKICSDVSLAGFRYDVSLRSTSTQPALARQSSVIRGDLVASMAKIGLFQNVWMSQCTVDKTGPLIYIQ
jgi:hypothetical protein